MKRKVGVIGQHMLPYNVGKKPKGSEHLTKISKPDLSTSLSSQIHGKAMLSIVLSLETRFFLCMFLIYIYI